MVGDYHFPKSSPSGMPPKWSVVNCLGQEVSSSFVSGVPPSQSIPAINPSACRVYLPKSHLMYMDTMDSVGAFLHTIVLLNWLHGLFASRIAPVAFRHVPPCFDLPLYFNEDQAIIELSANFSYWAMIIPSHIFIPFLNLSPLHWDKSAQKSTPTYDIFAVSCLLTILV